MPGINPDYDVAFGNPNGYNDPNDSPTVTNEPGQSGGSFDWNDALRVVGDTAGSVWGAPGQQGGIPQNGGPAFRQGGNNNTVMWVVVIVLLVLVFVGGFIYLKKSS